MLNGDLTRFSPGDLLTFLSHLNQEGVLTVSRGDEGLNVHFRKGLIVAAHSEQADGKVLEALRASGVISSTQFVDLDRARRETGLPLGQILTDSGDVELDSIAPIITTGIHEVIFQLFTWGTGEFQFNEITLDQPAAGQAFDCTALMMDAARQVDEYREFQRNIASENLILVPTRAAASAPESTDEIRYVLHGAKSKKAVQEVILKGPFTSFATAKAVEEAVQNGWLELRTDEGEKSEPVAPPQPEPATEGGPFLSYKRSTLKVLQAQGKQQQIAELISYCRDNFDYFIMFDFLQNEVGRSLRFQRDKSGRRLGVELPTPTCGLESDPTFGFVCESQVPFFGQAFDSPLLKALGEPQPDGDCAIVPLGGKGDKKFLLYVTADGAAQVPGPLHYLELISWLIHSPSQDKQLPESPVLPVSQTEALAQPAVTDKIDAAKDLIAVVNELPPMPQVVSQVLALLSDPNSQRSDMIKVLSRDPALVARLIRVSNSALYGRGEETTSLGQAVVRLGANTVRSLVMAASMKSLFPLDNTNIGLWGQALWQHAVECGLAARHVAQIVGYYDPEEAFVAGVLHDVGKVVILLHRTEEFKLIKKQQAAGQVGFAAAEKAVLGFDHTAVGDLLLDKWGMPGDLRACVKHHHDPVGATENVTLVRIVAVGNMLSHAFGSQPDTAAADCSNEFEHECAELGLTPDKTANLMAEITSYLEHSGLLD